MVRIDVVEGGVLKSLRAVGPLGGSNESCCTPVKEDFAATAAVGSNCTGVVRFSELERARTGFGICPGAPLAGLLVVEGITLRDAAGPVGTPEGRELTT